MKTPKKNPILEKNCINPLNLPLISDGNNSIIQIKDSGIDIQFTILIKNDSNNN